MHTECLEGTMGGIESYRASSARSTAQPTDSGEEVLGCSSNGFGRGKSYPLYMRKVEATHALNSVYGQRSGLE